MTDAARAGANDPLLEFREVRISYFIRAVEVNVIPRMSFSLRLGEAQLYVRGLAKVSCVALWMAVTHNLL